MPWRSSNNMFDAKTPSNSRRSSDFRQDPLPPPSSSSHQEEQPGYPPAIATSSSEASPVMTSLSGGRSPQQQQQQQHQQTLSSSATVRRRTPMPSGLSALIQAATAQLSLLAEEQAAEDAIPSSRDHVERQPLSGATTDSGTSSDGGGTTGGKSTARTPTIVPEPDPAKQSFPELLMALALDPNNKDTIAFLPDGKFFTIRSKEFEKEVMIHYFAVTSFEEFLDLTYDWGFTRILTQAEQSSDNLGIEVFRHPQFMEGDWTRCALMKIGETPTDARLSALPDRARIEYTMSDESNSSTPGGAAAGAGAGVPGGPQSKRRLSPGFIKRRESEGSAGASAASKKRHSLDGSGNGLHVPSLAAGSVGLADSEAGDVASYANHSRSDDVRSVALALTTEKLNLRSDSVSSAGPDHGGAAAEASSGSTRLVDQAVKSATYTIVTDAIETLLHDESHTQETYLKHQRELSKSCLPGVVPISKQLFEPRKDGSTNMNAAHRDHPSPPKEVTTTTVATPPSAATTASPVSVKKTASTRTTTRRRRSMPEFRERQSESAKNTVSFHIPSDLTSQATNPPPPKPAIVSTTTSTTLAS